MDLILSAQIRLALLNKRMIGRYDHIFLNCLHFLPIRHKHLLNRFVVENGLQKAHLVREGPSKQKNVFRIMEFL